MSCEFDKIGVPVDIFELVSDHEYDAGVVKNQIVRFDSFFEYIEKIDLLMEEKTYEYSANDEWVYGTDFNNRDEARKALSVGLGSMRTMDNILKIKESMLNLDEIQRTLTKFETMRRRRLFKEEGSELCIDRLLCGSPEHWQKTTKGLQKPIVRLAINNVMSANNSEEMMNKLAALLVVACEMMEKAGYNVEIVSIATWTGSNKGYKYSVSECIIKRASEPLDIAKLSTLGLPSIGRWLYFACCQNGWHGQPRWVLGDGSGRGRILPALTQYLNIQKIISQEVLKTGSYGIQLNSIFESVEGLTEVLND